MIRIFRDRGHVSARNHCSEYKVNCSCSSRGPIEIFNRSSVPPFTLGIPYTGSSVREMDHNYSETSQKIKAAESLKTSHPQGVKSGFKEPKIIKYTGGVSLASGDKGGLFFQRLNKVSTFQKIFQAKNPLPVHLKRGRNDELIYKGLMTASVVSLVVAAFSVYKLAMPSRPK